MKNKRKIYEQIAVGTQNLQITNKKEIYNIRIKKNNNDKLFKKGFPDSQSPTNYKLAILN